MKHSLSLAMLNTVHTVGSSYSLTNFSSAMSETGSVDIFGDQIVFSQNDLTEGQVRFIQKLIDNKYVDPNSQTIKKHKI